MLPFFATHSSQESIELNAVSEGSVPPPMLFNTAPLTDTLECYFQVLINEITYFNDVPFQHLSFIIERIPPEDFENKFKDYVKRGNNLDACRSLLMKREITVFPYNMREPSLTEQLGHLANILWQHISDKLSELQAPVITGSKILG